MKKEYRISPAIGVARVGNSPDEFYIGPEKTGGLPIRCDSNGNPEVDGDDQAQYVTKFKDAAGAIKRQAARFRVQEYHDGALAGEASPGGGDIKDIKWTVHLANKKSAWYQFSELEGDTMFGPWNSYENQHVPLRNSDVTSRQQLITDPGPRSVSSPGEKQTFTRYDIPADYQKGSFPPENLQNGFSIDTLGEIMMDDAGRLLVLGGFGRAGGQTPLSSFKGGDQWWDDISDGFVLATITFKDGTTQDLEPAWVFVGSPKYAPELVNIITLDECIYDTSVRYMGFNKNLYDPDRFGGDSGAGYDPCAGFNPDYWPGFERDIKPIITRPQSYRWVANVPSMVDFSEPDFDITDPSEENRGNREEYFGYYRVPVPAESYEFINKIENGPNQLLHETGLPLMPLNSGDNSVSNNTIYKFLTLTPTQYFFMRQWSLGRFTVNGRRPENDSCVTEEDGTPAGVSQLDREVLGNCVGGPFSPGIEVTWVVRNKAIYSSPYHLKIAHWDGSNESLEKFYAGAGLNPQNNPQDGDGMEPGDLTKFMAIPWQADFFDCTVQTPNITNPAVNQSPADDGIQIPPSYYVYWWPPQSPMFVIAGSVEPADQVLDGIITFPPTYSDSGATPGSYNVTSDFQVVAAGMQVAYQRGLTSFGQMVGAWADLGFIVNKGTGKYPYFVESERNTLFMAQGVQLGSK